MDGQTSEAARTRMQDILDLLAVQDSVSVAALAKRFSVSEVTVRSDLSSLARRGLLARTRGGARPLQHGQSEIAFDVRLRVQDAEKRAIAKAAAALVADGEAIALDSSTTAFYIALELRERRELVVVTNGLRIAEALADAAGVSVIVVGGMLRRSAMSLVGEFSAEVLRTTRINKGFLGARGLSLERGLMDLNPEEVRTKQAIANACEQVYGVLDGTKWHRSALLTFVATDDIDGIVTDAAAPADAVEAWRAAGVEVVTAASAPDEPAVQRPRDSSRTVRIRDRRP